MKWMMLPLTRITGINVLCWMQLLIYVTKGQQKGMNEQKAPEDLFCYQNYTLNNNFGYCSWRAGKESQNPTYTLHYCLLRDGMDCQDFDAGNLTHCTLGNEEVHMRENISIAVTAEEKGQNYTSKQITLVLDKAVKLDPPDHKKVNITRDGSNITVSWTRSDFFPGSLNTRKEVRYEEHSSYSDPLPCKISTSVARHPDHDDIPISKEDCRFALDNHRGHHVQIRQAYEEGVWSEWSDAIFVPAEIGPLQIDVNTGRLTPAGTRNLSLLWKLSTEEEGSMNYRVDVTFLHCYSATTSHLTKHNSFYANISGAGYNISVIASNQAQAASPWTTVIEEDWAAIPFQNITLSGNNLTMEWRGKKAEKASYCIVSEASEMKGAISSDLVETLNNNNATILTDNFVPMKCYKIYIHKMDKNPITMGTTYYFKPSLSIGPRNLTVMNVTVSSVLLRWDPFDLQECQGILQNWIINRRDQTTNTSQETYEDSSVTRHLVEGLPLGFNYSFEVKGVTIFGEQTGSSCKCVSSPQPAENTNKRLLEKTAGILGAFLLAALCLIFSRFRINQCLCPEIPHPFISNATAFTISENKYISCPKHLVQSNSEEKNTEPFIIETRRKNEAVKTDMKEIEMLALVNTEEEFDNELIMTESDTEVEIDLQFEYRKQLAPMTPIKEKDTEADLSHPSECAKENDALLSLTDINMPTS
ncbi:interleukin-12 receptor subunit beta-1 [Eleutherodactylus coqui]|uniref:interleukin-12 receptor subunit beta-1 n=1 Tax=Eleutherodactylus coqui TaxID=57060 RepID=UPI0034620E78